MAFSARKRGSDECNFSEGNRKRHGSLSHGILCDNNGQDYRYRQDRSLKEARETEQFRKNAFLMALYTQGQANQVQSVGITPKSGGGSRVYASPFSENKNHLETTYRRIHNNSPHIFELGRMDIV